MMTKILFFFTSFLLSDISQDDNEDDQEEFEEMNSFKGVAQSYRLNFAPGIRNLFVRLQRGIMEASNQLVSIQRDGRSVKYYLSLRCQFYKPTEPDIVTDVPCVFNSETCNLMALSSVKKQMEINYLNITHAVENFESKGSGKYLIKYNLHSIVMLFLWI